MHVHPPEQALPNAFKWSNGPGIPLFFPYLWLKVSDFNFINTGRIHRTLWFQIFGFFLNYAFGPLCVWVIGFPPPTRVKNKNLAFLIYFIEKKFQIIFEDHTLISQTCQYVQNCCTRSVAKVIMMFSQKVTLSMSMCRFLEYMWNPPPHPRGRYR